MRAVLRTDEEDGGASTTGRAGDAEPRVRGRRRAVASVAALLILGGVLRALWADAYLPYAYHWDEQTNVRVGTHMVEEAALDPGFYNYPALVFLVQSAVLVPAQALGAYDPDERPIFEQQAVGSAEVDDTGTLRALRWALGVIPGIVTIAAAGAIAWLATRRAWVTALASGVVALSAIDLRFGMYVTPDAMTGAAATLAGLGASAITVRPSRRLYLATGAIIGLAGASKYNAAGVAVGLVVAHVMASRRGLVNRRWLLEAAGIAAVVFAVTNVGAVLHPVEFVRGVGSEANHYSTGHFGNEGASPLFNAGWLLRAFGLALPLALCSLLARTDRIRQIAVVLLVQSGTYVVFISLFPVRFARNLLPVTGTTAAVAAIGAYVVVDRAASASRQRGGRLLHGMVGVAIVAAVVAVPAYQSAQAMQAQREDPWRAAQEWVDENVPDGSLVVVESRAPVLDDERWRVETSFTLGSAPFSGYLWAGVDYVVGTSDTFQALFDDRRAFPEESESYDRLLSPRCVVREFEGAGRRIVIAQPAAHC